MYKTVFEESQEQKLLMQLLQAHGIDGKAVIIWNPTELMGQQEQTGEEQMSMSEEQTEELSEEARTRLVQEQIANRMVEMGFRRGQVGFNNIVLSIYEVSRVPRGNQIRVTSDIYPKVAAYFGSSVYSVERTIRNAIESVWKRSNLNTLEELYPYPCDNLNGRPTNAEFLINMGVKYRP